MNIIKKSLVISLLTLLSANFSFAAPPMQGGCFEDERGNIICIQNDPNPRPAPVPPKPKSRPAPKPEPQQQPNPRTKLPREPRLPAPRPCECGECNNFFSNFNRQRPRPTPTPRLLDATIFRFFR